MPYTSSPFYTHTHLMSHDFALSPSYPLPQVVNCLIAILESDTAQYCAEVLLPYMEQYQSLLTRVCYEHALFHRTLSKMTSSLLEIYTNILLKVIHLLYNSMTILPNNFNVQI